MLAATDAGVYFSPAYHVVTYNNKNTEVNTTQPSCGTVNSRNCPMFPVAIKNPKMNIAPKNILPNATTFDGSSFSAFFEMIVSVDHNNTAININTSGTPKPRFVNLSKNRFPANNNIAATINPLFSFSFKKNIARTLTKINIDLCNSAAVELGLIDNPLKNSKNGIDPPKNPIAINFNHCLLFNVLKVFASLNKINSENKNNTTNMFFDQVKIYGFIPFTPNLFTKIDIPLTSAVNRTNRYPFFIIGLQNNKEYKYFLILHRYEGTLLWK